jgi:hypothetical protein
MEWRRGLPPTPGTPKQVDDVCVPKCPEIEQGSAIFDIDASGRARLIYESWFDESLAAFEFLKPLRAAQVVQRPTHRAGLHVSPDISRGNFLSLGCHFILPPSILLHHPNESIEHFQSIY